MSRADHADAATARAFGKAVRDKLASGSNWTVRELAQASARHEKTIAKQVRAGVIRRVQNGTRSVRIAAGEAARYLGESGVRA